MQLEDALYDIRECPTKGIPEQLLVSGVATVLGDSAILGPHAHRIYTDIIRGIDIMGAFLKYDLKISEEYPEITDALDCNIIVAFPDLVTGAIRIIVASAPPEETGMATAAVMRRIEEITSQSAESLIALAAFGAREEYRQVVAKLSNQPRRDILREGTARISFRGRGSKKRVVGDYEKTSPEKVSEREIREAYDNLPDRYSDLFEKRNPETASLIRHSLDVIDRKGLVSLLFEVAKTDRNLFRKLDSTRKKLASRYGIEVRRWSSDQKPHFKDQYNYCLYVVDTDGTEIPLKFKNNPSYCIFMMHVLDRCRRGSHATSLSIKENKEEFKKLYGSVFNETHDRINAFCDEMTIRKTADTGMLRKGRYDDYIKDINDTIDTVLGLPYSLSLKIGHGQFLEIPPDNIKIDPEMPKFNFV